MSQGKRLFPGLAGGRGNAGPNGQSGWIGQEINGPNGPGAWTSLRAEFSALLAPWNKGPTDKSITMPR